MKRDAVIRIEDVELEKKGHVILKDLNYVHSFGALTYVVGATGSGKSTLLKSLYGQHKISRGRLEVAGVQLNELVGDELSNFRRKIGMIFQEMHLFEDWTCYQNLDFVLRATDWRKDVERQARIFEVLSSIGLTDHKESYVASLSGGQKQKLAVARALLNNPEIILADEPTAFLDHASADELMYLFHRINSELGTALLIVTHDDRIINKFPARVFECKEGRFTERR